MAVLLYACVVGWLHYTEVKGLEYLDCEIPVDESIRMGIAEI